MSLTSESPGFRLNGWHVLAMFVLFFGVDIAVNTGFVIMSVKTFPGEVSVTPYEDGLLHDRAVAINRTQMFAPRSMRHVCGNVRIMSAEGRDGFASQTNFMLLQTLVEGPTTIHLAGRYYDRFVRVDGRLKLKERQVVYDSAVIATDVVYPV